MAEPKRSPSNAYFEHPRPTFFLEGNRAAEARQTDDPFTTPPLSATYPHMPRGGVDPLSPFNGPSSPIVGRQFSCPSPSPSSPLSAYPFPNVTSPEPSAQSDSVYSSSAIPSRTTSASDFRGVHVRRPAVIRSSTGRDSLSYPPARRVHSTGNASARNLRRATELRRARSTALPEATEIEKPWLLKKDRAGRLTWWITIAMMMLGVILGATRCFFAVKDVRKLDKICLVFEDNFNTLNTDIWSHENDLGGFGNGEFEMTTASPNNSFVQDGILYLVPTLTADVIGAANVMNGFTYNITGCTNANLTACGAVSNSTAKTIINPVQSARITTRKSYSIKYGKVEIRARIPKGDWIWPALWMMPVNSTYGPWPLSGEIDIMESRGNNATYPKQGRNYVRGSLNWGPVSFLNRVHKTFGFWVMRRSDFSDDFHTYTLEWTEGWLRVYLDSRLKYTLDMTFDEPFFKRGQFPATVSNGSQEIILSNPWAGRGNSAPFDQEFFLIMNVAVGGTNGWFPDAVGGKPWLDGSLSAMYDFAQAQDQWYPTWPADKTQRGLAIDSVKMWKMC